jgi:hypothetical protein
MPKTQREEHKRLQRRTDELKRDHAALSRDVQPFDKTQHDAHTADLKKHKADLRRHQKKTR